MVTSEVSVDDSDAAAGLTAAPAGSTASTGGAGSPSASGTGWAPAPIGRVAAPLRDQVLDTMRRGIFESQLRPGQRLIERELMEQLGVSRATVREVVARLESEGLVTTIPQRGAIVTVLSADDAADIYEMRVALEALAVRHFVERATPEQVREVRAAFEVLAAIPDSENSTIERLRAKDALYRVLLDGAASPVLTQTLTSLQSRVRLLRQNSLSVPGRSEQMVEEIRAVVEAIEAGDGYAAGEACAQHVRMAAATGIPRMMEAQRIEPDSSLVS
jgi:DNA-binding GntR family transcriptional regulator